MRFEEISLAECAAKIVDNRGKTCPVGNAGRPLIATNCLREGTLYPTYETTRFVSDETYKTWFRGHPAPGDIIFVTKGSPGRVCLAPSPVDFCIAQDMVAIRADERKVYSRYLFAVLRSEEAQRRITNMHVGTLIPHFKKGDFDKLFLPVPDRAAQVAIGDLYFDLSSRIDLLQRTNSTLEAVARTLFKSWFVDFDPVRAKAEGRDPEGMDAATATLFPSELEESGLGPIPKGWCEGKLTVLCDLNALSWSTRSPPAEVAYVDLAGVKANAFDPPQRYSFVDAPSRARRVLRAGDTLVGTVRPGNRSFGFIGVTEPGLTGSTGFAVLSPKAPSTAAFVYLCATRDENIERLAALADGGAYPAVRPELVQLTECVLPPKPVLEAFHSAAAPALMCIWANTKRACVLAELRDALLPRLLSGRLRLPECQEEVREAIA